MGEREETVRFGLRLPKSLYDYLTTQAQGNNRSINSEIIARLNPNLWGVIGAHGQEAIRLLIAAMLKLTAEQKDKTILDIRDQLQELIGEGEPSQGEGGASPRP
jgi:hypothetical protein